MSKRKRKPNKKTNENRRKEGRGTGVLGNYKPWLLIQDVASLGLATRVKGLKTGRVHHLLSKLELSCFLCLDWAETVFDIREQFPLYLLETLAIAKELNIKHPRVPVTKEVVVMTTDFLVTLRTASGDFKEIAVSAKYSKDLDNARSLEKLELERFYWTRRGIEFFILTEKEINQTLVKNIDWLHSLALIDFQALNIPLNVFSRAVKFMRRLLESMNIPLRNATNACDANFSFASGTSLLIVRYLIANRIWHIDLQTPIQPEKPITFTAFSKGGTV